MRSSRRNLGLQPELTPEDSDLNGEEEDVRAPSEEERDEEDPQSESLEDPVRAATSEDVNLDDSNFSKVTSDSESEEEVVAETS